MSPLSLIFPAPLAISTTGVHQVHRTAGCWRNSAAVSPVTTSVKALSMCSHPWQQSNRHVSFSRCYQWHPLSRRDIYVRLSPDIVFRTLWSWQQSWLAGIILMCLSIHPLHSRVLRHHIRRAECVEKYRFQSNKTCQQSS